MEEISRLKLAEEELVQVVNNLQCTIAPLI
jgi:hypothetical protein